MTKQQHKWQVSDEVQAALRDINRLTHHIQHCARCQDFLIETIANDPSVTAGMMWTRIQGHANTNNAKGLA